MRERVDFTEKARCEGTTLVDTKILNAHRSGQQFTKTVIQEPSFWKDFLWNSSPQYVSI